MYHGTIFDQSMTRTTVMNRSRRERDISATGSGSSKIRHRSVQAPWAGMSRSKIFHFARLRPRTREGVACQSSVVSCRRKLIDSSRSRSACSLNRAFSRSSRVVRSDSIAVRSRRSSARLSRRPIRLERKPAESRSISSKSCVLSSLRLRLPVLNAGGRELD